MLEIMEIRLDLPKFCRKYSSLFRTERRGA